MFKETPKKLEAVLWSIALPGFAQILNRKIIKGLTFIFLEFLVNVFSSFNLAIVHSFQGNIDKAIAVTDYQWLMFYPCLYMFAMWDAYRDAEGEISPFAYMPFVFGAYFLTVGLIYSSQLKLFGILIGPVFLPMLFLIPGMMVGYFIRWLLLKYSARRK